MTDSRGQTGPATAKGPAFAATGSTPSGDETHCDALVVGGGINGAGIARDLAGRGASVLLCEQHDLASHTSSASTKLVHGGLRYLEHREFSLVRKSLVERELLLRSAPHIMWPLRFVMPHDAGLRPAWLIRAGLFLYDHLARRELLPGSETLDLRRHPAGAALHDRFRRGFAYSDGWVDDARLVVLNAVAAAEHGARIWTGWRCSDAQRGPERWALTLENTAGQRRRVSARALVNAAGPWAAQFLQGPARGQPAAPLRLVKGSHIVVRRVFDHDHAYLFQNPDGRILFAIPYEQAFTLIGTTDVEHQGPIGEARIDAAEIDYLCAQASRWLKRPVCPADVVWSFSGVRPLLGEGEDGSTAAAVTRDYRLELDTAAAPLLSVWGGKITTFRKLAEEAADRLARPLGLRRGAWTAGAFLPGGDLRGWIGQTATSRPDVDFALFEQALAARCPQWPPALRHGLARRHGARVGWLVDRPGGLGEAVVPGLHEAELELLRRQEWARTADDVLWRRTKLGLHLSAEERSRLATWCAEHWGDTVAEA